MSNQDFHDFLSGKKQGPSEQTSQQVLNLIHRDLEPQHKIIFLKILAIQAFIGALTLLLCPQFNFSLSNNYQVFHFFHKNFGHYGCMAACGSVFLGSGAVFASSLLSYSEIQKIKQTKILYYLTFSGMTVLSFLFIGAEIYLDAALFWMLGASTGGLLSFELGRIVKTKVLTH